MNNINFFTPGKYKTVIAFSKYNRQNFIIMISFDVRLENASDDNFDDKTKLSGCRDNCAS